MSLTTSETTRLRRRVQLELGASDSAKARALLLPRLSRPDLQNARRTSRLRFSELCEKVGRLFRPLAPNFGPQDKQSRSTVALPRLGERTLLASLGLQVCGCPSPASGDTSVVSGVSCAHLKRGRPSLTTSSLRPSACTLSKARSRRNTFVETVAPSLHTLVATLSPPLPSKTLRGGGHWSHGHTGKRERSEEGRARNSFDENLEWWDTGSRSSRPCRPGRRPWATAPHPGTSNPD